MQTNSHLSVLVRDQAEIYGNRTALEYKEFGGKEWKKVSWNTFSEQVRRVSLALLSLGVGVQEKVAVFSQNTLQYVYTDFGAWGIRACTVPFYATTSEEAIQFMVNDAQIRFIFCGEQEQYDRARRVQHVCPTVEKLIVFDRRVRFSTHDPSSVYFDEFVKFGDNADFLAEYEERLAAANWEDLACILYTSGTTGNPKGVMLTHGQFRAAFVDNHKGLDLKPEDRVLNFLPFAHIFEKGWALLALTEGCTMIINTNPHEVQDAMRETHPTCMSSVPRFWEKVYTGVIAEIEAANPMRQRLFLHALEIGRRHNIDYLSKGKRPPVTLQVEYMMLDRTVFSMVRKRLGIERPHFFPTAGSFVSPKVEEFIHSIGIFMMVGYGLTESLATVSNDHVDKPYTIGSIGRPIESLDIKFSEEGEILLKGPTITKGYYNRPDLNEAAFTPDGYFRTGDVGYMKDGELYITERIKDLYKTSNGKYIAPQLVESKILVDKYVEQVAVIADKRKFVSALIVPNYQLLEKYAYENGIEFADREALCADKRINAMFAERLETLQQSLAGYEQVKKFTLMAHHFSLEKGEITNTLKIRRNVLNKNYSEIIKKMYEE
ncbi:long-chain fatty acid--CoA ligase [Prevotella sp. PINT]|jgi:Long-chain acyl-CoA synthetases (AMP-forming)|uniref:AMP-dependent synthetase/ligase n=1 Tax=Palleniella intestinalis TaxID=2736291 RepID=UPI001551BCBA|nr:long-chain fatty acid--CoA ligase [Palleniella intestinalis]NPD81796.1 long-chain fatty acid--CoA ligase [Palleniella intestinalis]